MNAIKTAYDLKRKVTETGSFFFTRESMKFFGDTMENYGLRGPAPLETRTGMVNSYELVRRKPVKSKLQDSAFFCAETFKRALPK